MDIEKQIIELHAQKLSMRQIALQLKCSTTNVRYYYTKLGLVSNFSKNRNYSPPLMYNIAGEKFGKLQVIKRSNSKSPVEWECLCDCGNIKIASTILLKKGKVTSCGNSLHRTGENSGTWKGIGDLGYKYWTTINKNAIKRKLEVSISLEFIWELFISQDKKCALTDLPLIIEAKNRTASLDRIDSKKGYTKENVQWVHKDINQMKMDLDENRLVELSKLLLIKKGII